MHLAGAVLFDMVEPSDRKGGRGKPMYRTAWIEAEGLVNLRDTAGLPAIHPRLNIPLEIQPLRLLRSDNLQTLTPTSINQLVEELNLTDVVDLRTELERTTTGPGPLHLDGRVTIHGLSLYVENSTQGALPDAAQDRHNDPATEPDSGEDVDDKPWGDEWDSHTPETQEEHIEFLSHHYLHYFQDRPENVLTALKTIAHAEGATLVHCAAGKDRTGCIVGLALAIVGVPKSYIAYDYSRSNERLLKILGKLSTQAVYAVEVEANQEAARQATPAGAILAVLRLIEQHYGSLQAYLEWIGWTEADTLAMRAKLLGMA